MPNASSKPQSKAANGLRAVRPTRRAPARVAPLATLPVFADLRGRPVLVAGGGEGAAWKAELLAAAGADVTLVLCGGETAFCEEACDVRDRIATDSPSHDHFGTLCLDHRQWAPSDLSGHATPDVTGVPGDRPAMALIDTECHGEAAAFAALARASGVTVNAVDKPFHGDFTFGSIVNRSPVVVGISTDGAAPILGQAIRQRIETLLPPTLADWAARMRETRSRVLSLLPDKAQRRTFFARFAQAAFGAGTVGSPLDIADGVRRGDGREVGHVTLVGAGPGDAGHLTLAAVRALQSADVILFDALVSEEVLELARREARRMLVGKRAGRESCRQEEINALMLKLAREGRRVVRLKSGDPMIFGRAGEEIEALRKARISHEVLPGITSAQALASRLGISLTHREVARSLRFVTGHGSDGRLPLDLDWQSLADPGTTLIVYMGARTAGLIAERLIETGLPPGTDACAAAAIGRPEEAIWRGSLADLEKGVNDLPPDQPTLIAIGAIVASAVQTRTGSKLRTNRVA